eukprot:161600_1
MLSEKAICFLNKDYHRSITWNFAMIDSIQHLFILYTLIRASYCIICGDTTANTSICGPSGNLKCIGERQCQYDHLYCMDNAPCYIDCNGDYSCINTVITANVVHQFTMICDSDDACDSSNINIGSAYSVDLQYTGRYTNYMAFNAVNLSTFDLRCSRCWSCKGVDINIQSVNEANIVCDGKCDGYGSCRSTNFYAKNINQLYIICDDHKQSCAGAGITVDSAADITIECNGYNSCGKGMQLTANIAKYVTVFCTYSNSCSRFTIDCGAGTCILHCTTNDACSDIGSINVANAVSFQCHGYCNQPNIPDSFTAFPTLQSMAPSIAPTIEPTFEPTLEPIIKPTIEPTTQPTYTPTVNPTDIIIKPSTTPSSIGTSISYLIIFLVFIIVIIVVIFCIYNRKYKQFEKHLIISNPMVITLGIGSYNNNDNVINDLDVEYNDIPVDKDVNNLKMLFDELNYETYPQYAQLLNNDNYMKIKWTEKELMDLLTEKAQYFESNINKYDGLIV